jgi:hypothetical protein
MCQSRSRAKDKVAAMLEAQCRTPLAKATADLMGAWALAASKPAIRTLKFWTHVLRSSLVFPAVAHPRTISAYSEGPTLQPEEKQQPTSTGIPATEPGFSSYRSSGGHAVAQVIVAETN